MDINSRNSSETNHKPTESSRIYAVIFMAISVFFCAVLVTGGYLFGAFGRLILQFLLGVFGFAAYPAFIASLIASVLMFMRKKVTMSKRHVITFSLMFVIGILCIHLFTTTAFYPNMGYGQYLGYCYSSPADGFSKATGGGVVSGLIVYPIAKFLSLPGAYIILIGAFLVTIFFSIDSLRLKLKNKSEKRRVKVDDYIDYDVEKRAASDEERLQPLYQNVSQKSQYPPEYRSVPRETVPSAPLYINQSGETYADFMEKQQRQKAKQSQPVNAPELPQPNDRQLFVNTMGADYNPKKTAVNNHKNHNQAITILHADIYEQNARNNENRQQPIDRKQALNTLYQGNLPSRDQTYTEKYSDDTKKPYRTAGELRDYIFTPPPLTDVYGDIINEQQYPTSKSDVSTQGKPQRIVHEGEQNLGGANDGYVMRYPENRQTPNVTTRPPQLPAPLPYIGGGEAEPPRIVRPTTPRQGYTEQPNEPTRERSNYAGAISRYTKNVEQAEVAAEKPRNEDSGVQKVVDFDKYRELKQRAKEKEEQEKIIIRPEPPRPVAPPKTTVPDRYVEDTDDDEEDAVTTASKDGSVFIPPTFASQRKKIGGFEQMGIDEIDEPTDVSFGNRIPQAVNIGTGEKIVKKPPIKLPEYVAPPIDLIERRIMDIDGNNDSFIEKGKILESTLHEFGIPAKISGIVPGPTVTRYELSMPHGIKVKKVTEVSDDIALRLAATNIRIEAPIPGKSLFGIEVPNSKKLMVGLREVIDSQEFVSASSPLTFAIGKDVAGNNIVENICKMPHLLVAGATGTGKSVCLNTLIVSLLYKASPADLRFILVDPKSVEFTVYNGLPHMLLPQAITAPDKAISAFNWAIHEMERRYALFKELNSKDITSYHQKYNPEIDEHLPYIVIIVDEFNDLMMVSKGEIEDKIVRLTQKARAAGIHLILATQRPTVDVISGTIKNNLPSRIALTVTSSVDSKTILDYGGAESLLGNGDMLYKSPSRLDTKRLQGAFIGEHEVENIVEFIKDNNEAFYDAEIEKDINAPQSSGSGIGSNGASGGNSEDDRYIADALPLMIRANKATVNFIQTKLSVGYPRASRLMDIMEDRGYVSPLEANEPRKVLITMDEYNNIFGGNK